MKAPPPGSSPDAAFPILDRERIDSIRGIPEWGESCFRNAGSIFLQQTPVLLAELKAALAEGDAARLHRAAHTLKGSALSIGLVRLAHAAGDLQAAVAAQGPADLAHLARIIREEGVRGCAALGSELADGHGSRS